MNHPSSQRTCLNYNTDLPESYLFHRDELGIESGDYEDKMRGMWWILGRKFV